MKQNSQPLAASFSLSRLLPESVVNLLEQTSTAMLISSIDELRIFSPSIALDEIDSMIGFVNSSEQDFLQEKLGIELYAALQKYYNRHVKIDIYAYLSAIRMGDERSLFMQLLFLCQRAVAFDALARSIGIQAVSVNGAGVNVAATDDYKTASSELISDFKKTCVREAHSAINGLLCLLEVWSQSTDQSSKEKTEICELWRKSKYFYLVKSLIIPSAVVLQDYLNIYESREKFIQLLPELRYIQEDIVSPVFGEDLIEYLAELPWSREVDPSPHSARILHFTRKIIAKYLESRLNKGSNEKADLARNEAIKLTSRLSDYLKVHNKSFSGKLADSFKHSPLHDAASGVVAPRYENNAENSVIFVTPGLV